MKFEDEPQELVEDAITFLMEDENITEKQAIRIIKKFLKSITHFHSQSKILYP